MTADTSFHVRLTQFVDMHASEIGYSETYCKPYNDYMAGRFTPRVVLLMEEFMHHIGEETRLYSDTKIELPDYGQYGEII